MEKRKDNNNDVSREMTHRKVYRRQCRGKLCRTQHICTIIMDRIEMGRALHIPSLPQSHKAEYRKIQRKMTTTFYISLIQQTVPRSNPRPWKQRTPRTTYRMHRVQNRKTLKPYWDRSRYYRDNNGRLERRRYRYTGLMPQKRHRGRATPPATELLPILILHCQNRETLKGGREWWGDYQQMTITNSIHEDASRH